MDYYPFLARIKTNGPDACWEWTGSCNNTGYGTVNWKGKTITAHRLMAYIHGLVDSPSAPKNKKATGFVLHSCDNPRCCNPKHFTIGTYSQNQIDAYKRKRREQPKGQNHTVSKLTNKQAANIRKQYLFGLTQVKLAKKYRVSQAAISLLVRGKTYR